MKRAHKKKKKENQKIIIQSAGAKALEAMSQSDLYAPIMEVLYHAKNHTMQVKDVKKQVIEGLQLRAGDQETLPSQNKRSRIYKTFENVISHRHTTTSPIYDGLIIYDQERGTMMLTPKGQRYRLDNPYTF
jgi:hypothetical protein